MRLLLEPSVLSGSTILARSRRFGRSLALAGALHDVKIKLRIACSLTRSMIGGRSSQELLVQPIHRCGITLLLGRI